MKSKTHSLWIHYQDPLSYTIDEVNAERQFLLARILNSPTTEGLNRIPKVPNGRCLDLGCGQGNTTRLLASVLEPAECIGFDYDQKLVDYASAHESNSPNVKFEQGNAMELPYADSSFDVVFTRYLLVHMADPDAVVQEMPRVVKPAGYAIAFEPDMSHEFSCPDSWGLKKMTVLWNGLFATPEMGRRLVATFRKAGVAVQAGCSIGMEVEPGDPRKIHRLSLESVREPALAKGLLTEAEYEAHLTDMKRLEADEDAVVVKFPDVWVIASR